MMCDVIELAIATVASQAADIEWLTAKRDELRALIASQAAEIERLRGRIQIAEGTLVAWLREQGGGVDPVRHALATLRAIP